MSEVKSFEDLVVWKKAHELVLKIYKLCVDFPIDEKYGLTQQLKRAAVSIPANIAEGHGRKTTKEYIQFLYISFGSLNEVKYYLRLSLDLGILSKDSHSSVIRNSSEVSKLLNALIKSLLSKTAT